MLVLRQVLIITMISFYILPHEAIHHNLTQMHLQIYNAYTNVSHLKSPQVASLL